MNTDVKPGQIWADNDWRSKGRTVRVERVDPRFAYCTVLTNTDSSQTLLDRDQRGAVDRRGKKTRILIERMRPASTGYRLLAEVPS